MEIILKWVDKNFRFLFIKNIDNEEIHEEFIHKNNSRIYSLILISQNLFKVLNMWFGFAF